MRLLMIRALSLTSASRCCSVSTLASRSAIRLTLSSLAGGAQAAQAVSTTALAMAFHFIGVSLLGSDTPMNAVSRRSEHGARWIAVELGLRLRRGRLSADRG